MIENTEGWITGLQFSGKGNFAKPVSKIGVGLFDFLGQQVLDRQSPALQDFLLRTFMLEEFDASLCQSVLSPLYPKSAGLAKFDQCGIQNSLFVLPVDADGKWLRYHHLFRDFFGIGLRRYTLKRLLRFWFVWGVLMKIWPSGKRPITSTGN